MQTSARISFFKRLKPHILSGRKCATLRNHQESHFKPGQILVVFTQEDETQFATIRVISVEPVAYQALTKEHAKAENLPLFILRWLIRRIYPGEEQLYFIRFELCSVD